MTGKNIYKYSDLDSYGNLVSIGYIYFSLPFIFVESDWLYVMGLRAESMSCVYKKITLMHINVRM